MAITSAQTAAILADRTAYKERVKFYMQKAAVAILGEASPTANRHDYSVLVLAGQASVQEMATATVTNATVEAAINLTLDDLGVSDALLESTVNSLWDDFGAQQGDVV